MEDGTRKVAGAGAGGDQAFDRRGQNIAGAGREQRGGDRQPVAPEMVDHRVVGIGDEIRVGDVGIVREILREIERELDAGESRASVSS